MKSNGSVTLYNKYVDPSSHAEKFQRTQIKDVYWESRKAANVLASGGQISVDAAALYIPFQRGANYLGPRVWTALTSKTGKWTLQEGDVILDGLASDEIGDNFTISDLKHKYDDVFVISSVDAQDVGSPGMQHWQVGAR